MFNQTECEQSLVITVTWSVAKKLRVLTLGFCQGGGISWSFYTFVLFKNLFRIFKRNKLQN